MIGPTTLRALVGLGLSSAQILAVSEALEADARPKDRNAAERQRRRRDRLKAEGGAGETAGSDLGKAASGVTSRATTGVTDGVTGGVTCDSSPLDENISNPPFTTQTPEGVIPLPSAQPSRKATRLPDDFVMPADWKQWAREQRGWAADAIEAEAENFADYWQARATGATKRDWRKAWQNWVRNAKRRDGSHRAARPEARPSSPEEQARAAEEHAARLERIGRPEDAAEVRRRWSTGPPRTSLLCLPPAATAGVARRS